MNLNADAESWARQSFSDQLERDAKIIDDQKSRIDQLTKDNAALLRQIDILNEKFTNAEQTIHTQSITLNSQTVVIQQLQESFEKNKYEKEENQK